MTLEQQARDMIQRCGISAAIAQSLSAGDVVELTNLIGEVHSLREDAEEARQRGMDLDLCT